MKKILTILAATATLFAFGDDFTVSGTSFESYGTNVFNTAKDDSGDQAANTYWFTADNDAANVLSNYVGDVVNSDPKQTPTGVSRPDLFASSNNTTFLSVETTGKLFRTVEANGQDVSQFSQVEIPDSGIYLDTLVKFTAADSVFGDDALENNVDKIAIEYVEHESEGGDDPTVTNFVIRAGYVGLNGVITPTNYFAAVPAGFNKDAWHRLTVRTIAEVGSGENSAGVGFVVYLDQVPLAYSTSVEPGIAAYTAKFNSVVKENFYKNDLHAIYPSAVDAEMTAGRNISAVAFSGNGAIDDVVFTTDRPSFIQESTTVDVVWDEHVATLRLNGQTINVSSGNATTIEPTNGVIDVVVTFATGYRAGAFTADKGGVWEASISCFTGLVAGATCTISSMLPLYEVNGVAFDDLDAAMTAAATGTAQAPATLKLLADCNHVLGFTEGYIVLDLNGCDVQGGDDDACSILNSGAETLIITNSGAEASVRVPTNPYAEPPITLLAAAGLTIVQAGTFEGIVIPGEGTLTITGGKFLDVAGTFDPADPTTFYLVDPINCVAPGVVCTKSGDYVQVGGGAEPQPTTYTLTLTVPANVSVSYKIGEGAATAYTEPVSVESNATVTITAAPAANYTYTNVELGQGWTLSEGNAVYTIAAMEAATAVTVPTPTSAVLGTYQVTVIPTNNTSYAAAYKVGGSAITPDNDVLTVTVGQTIVITATPAANYEYATPPTGWTAGANGVITIEVSAEATVAIPGPTAKQQGGYPTYIDTTDAAEKAKYDAWKGLYGDDTGSAYEDAFLLNCAPANVATEKAAFKFTSISYDTTQSKWVTTTTTKNTSGDDHNGTVVVKQYSDVGCKTESATGTFFKAFLQ